MLKIKKMVIDVCELFKTKKILLSLNCFIVDNEVQEVTKILTHTHVYIYIHV